MDEKRNHGDRRPKPPERDEDCEPKHKRFPLIEGLLSILNKLTLTYDMAKDIKKILLSFKNEAIDLLKQVLRRTDAIDARLQKIEHQIEKLPILLPALDTLVVTQKRLEQKVDKMAIDLTKANAGLDALNLSFTEIVAEFAALKEQINDPASQAAVDAFGDKLAALGQAFKDINPDAVPPVEPTGNRRRQ